jgi:hypothetical protein
MSNLTINEPYFKPWIGKNYEANKVLLMSESTYDWLDEEGETVTPDRFHAQGSIGWNIENFRKNQYFTRLNRALCMTETPTAEQMKQAWDDYAYTVFVQGSVGFGAGTRPTEKHWQEAGPHFLSLLEQIQPLKVIVTGKDMWASMPDCAVYLVNDLQAYKLPNGQLVWCLALPHPANRVQGFRWREIGESIRLFKATNLPLS